ncbi:MAG: hypothetical protein WBC97_02355 [Gemmatimonadales bacterium]
MSVRTLSAMVLALCAAVPAALAGQQVADSARPAASVSAPVPSAPEPHASPLFQRDDHVPASSRASAVSPYFAGGDNHTFTISTLALVLGVVILVLLLVR